LRQVEYIFSVPTTWTEHSVVEDYRKITRKAGFGEGAKHSVKVSLTESEASAVYIANDQKHEFQVSMPLGRKYGMGILSISLSSGIDR
jgi:hypothetical protein